jgi:hypothetical protein
VVLLVFSQVYGSRVRKENDSKNGLHWVDTWAAMPQGETRTPTQARSQVKNVWSTTVKQMLTV